MAHEMLLLEADEVARNGALWKYFGQRCFLVPLCIAGSSIDDTPPAPPDGLPPNLPQQD
jgi:hypothetical protein